MKQVDYEKNLKNLKNNISGMKQGGFNQIFLISFYSLNSYFKSIIAFGRKHPITKDNLNIIKEVYQIFLKERKLLNFILKKMIIIKICLYFCFMVCNISLFSKSLKVSLSISL